MSPLGFHLTMRLRNSAVLASDAAAQRRLAGAVLRTARPWQLLAFRAADDHLHLLVVAARPEAGELARRVQIALVRALAPAVGFQPAWFEPVADGRHLRRAFAYVLRQDQRHGFVHDPLAEASNVPDLLGLRLTGLWTAPIVRRHLPRVSRTELLALLGAPDLDQRAPDLSTLGEATRAALCASTLDGVGGAVAKARTAAVQLAGDRLRRAELAAALSCSPRTVQRMRQEEADPAWVRAVEGQLRLRGGVVANEAFVEES